MERFFVHRLSAWAFRYFRPRRLRLFFNLFDISASTRILDIGGSAYFWQLAPQLGLPVPRVTIVNLVPPQGALPPSIRWVVADATRLPFAALSFDIAFCNSLIEHLYSFEAQALLASEIARIAPRYFVQTPSRSFPVEQHLLGLGVHWAPPGLRPVLMRWTTLAGLTARFDRRRCEEFSRELVLLDRTQLAALFPGSRLITERFCGLEKSLIVAR